jgi:hypothetical protein
MLFGCVCLDVKAQEALIWQNLCDVKQIEKMRLYIWCFWESF